MSQQETIRNLYEVFKTAEGVSTDTRKDMGNKLFFALSGPNFNGNQFAKTALEKGAKHVVVSEKIDCEAENQTIVQDTLSTLQDLAKHHREQLTIPVIAITGSNGKTTTKELTHAVLSSQFNCFATEGNLNNHIGVPLSLLSIKKKHEIAVLELGANHLKEIDFLCRIAAPDFGVITSIGKDHLEGYGSLEGVKKGSAELLVFLEENQKQFFLNSKDESVMEIMQGFERMKTIPLSDDEIHFVETSSYVTFQHEGNNYITQLAGDFNQGNILTAFSIGRYFNIPSEKIIEAIINYKPQNNRSQIIDTGKNIVFLDAYNANPTSMELAIKSFAKMENVQKVAFLGDMAELGEFSKTEHQNIATMAELHDFDLVLFCGPEFYSATANLQKTFNHEYFLSKKELHEFLDKNSITQKNILIKGSRSMKMEELVQFV